ALLGGVSVGLIAGLAARDQSQLRPKRRSAQAKCFGGPRLQSTDGLHHLPENNRVESLDEASIKIGSTVFEAFFKKLLQLVPVPDPRHGNGLRPLHVARHYRAAE